MKSPLLNMARALTVKLPSRLIGAILITIAIAVLFIQFWPRPDRQGVAHTAVAAAESDEPIQPIEALIHLDPRKIQLGRKLFNDPRFSHDNHLSCADCHNLHTGGTDHKVRSIGANGAVGMINAPTVFNSGFNFSQFWDGRVPTLEKQIDFPVQTRMEMNSNWPEVIGKLKTSWEYVRLFHQIYGDDVNDEHIKDSIAEFERSLATPNSRFDRYLRHDTSALSAREQQGYQLFKSFGCVSCHQGMNVGGNMFQKLGIMAPYFGDRGHLTQADLGRFNVTGDPNDRYMFKVPSLRNVELTAPYFHDGNATTLADAVSMMAKYQLGRHLTSEETELIVEFLKTLTGELDGKPL